MSLKEKLKYELKLRGYLSNTQLYEFCRTQGHKVSYAERELRHLMNKLDPDYTPEIIANRDKKDIIHGYKWKSKEQLF